jgi:hypothetical protein
MAICITMLFMGMSLHILSISLDQEKAIQRELRDFQERQIQAHERFKKRHEINRSQLSAFLTDPTIRSVDWIPDHLELNCDTGVFLYTTTEASANESVRAPVYHQRRHEPDVAIQLGVEKLKHQQKIPWADYAMIDYSRIYVLTVAGELKRYDAQQHHVMESYSLFDKINIEEAQRLNPQGWTGYLVTQHVVQAQIRHQYLWVVLQHSDWDDMMLWSLDISDPRVPLFSTEKSVLFSGVFSNQKTLVKPVAMMHPHSRRPGIVWAAEKQKLAVIQWFELGMNAPEMWFGRFLGSMVRWDRIMAIDRWQLGYPDRLYVVDTVGHIWKGNFFGGLSKKSLQWDCFYDTPQKGIIEQVKVVSGSSGGADIVQHKRQMNQSIVTILADREETDRKSTLKQSKHEKILYASPLIATVFIKSPYLYILSEGENTIKRFFLGKWRAHQDLNLVESLPMRNSMVTTSFSWSPQEQNFIWIGLNNNLCEKTVKIQGEYANFFTK